MKKKILLVTNGCSASWDTIEYAIWMARTFMMSITLLGIIENPEDALSVQEMFGKAIPLFQNEGIDYDLQLINGDSESVLREMRWKGDELLVIGTLGRSSLHHLLMRRTIHQIIEDVPIPILYARHAKKPIKKILVCFGGLGYATQAAKFATELALPIKAELIFLHVVPPIDLDYPVAKKILENWNHLLDTDTPPAQELRAAIKFTAEKGLKAQVIFRHGNPIHQIKTELQENDYDLVCMGSPFSDQDTLRHLYAPNVTAEIAEAVDTPILTVRGATPL